MPEPSDNHVGVYEPPEIRVLGTVKELTRGSESGTSDGGAIST